MSARMEARRIPGTDQVAFREWWGLGWTPWRVVDDPLEGRWKLIESLEEGLPYPPAGWIPPLPGYELGQEPVEVQHYLKIDEQPYEVVISGTKRFEWRLDDRDYEVGDVLELRAHTSMGEPLDRAVLVRVTYLMRDGYGLPPGFVVLSIEPFALAWTVSTPFNPSNWSLS